MPTSIIPVIVTFIIVMAFFSSVLNRRFHISHTKRYVITSGYFLVTSLLVLYNYRLYFKPLLQPVGVTPWAILVGLFVLNPLVYWYARKKLKRPTSFIDRNHDQNFIKLDYRYLVSKTFEIIFQQTCIIVLVSLFAQAGYSMFIIMLLFCLFFSVSHVPLFLTSRRRWACYYIVSSALAGFIFPPLILRVPSGYIYSFIVHWIFYISAGVGFWVYFDRLAKKQDALQP